MHASPSLTCQMCASKLLDCDIRIVSFVKKVQEAFPDCHVAVGFRDQADQHLAKITGKSNDDWPDSPHNYNINGHPCSRACDLFSLEPDGKAYFLQAYYESIWQWYLNNIAEFDNVAYEWGGRLAEFKRLRPHPVSG